MSCVPTSASPLLPSLSFNPKLTQYPTQVDDDVAGDDEEGGGTKKKKASEVESDKMLKEKKPKAKAGKKSK